MRDALREAGVSPARTVLPYTTGSTDRRVVEGFLQRCAFDDRVPLAEMEETPGPLADYLAGCRDGSGGYTFAHEAHLLTWENA